MSSPIAGELQPVAVLLPGARYSAERPLLHWCGALLRQSGWHVRTVSWDVVDEAREDPAAFVEGAVADAFVGVPRGARRMIVAKSLGTHALPWARQHRIPGVWLTPVLTDPHIRSALADAGPEDLAIGGDRDELWLPETLAGAAAQLLTVPGANHSLEIEGDWRASLVAQSDVFTAIAAHLGV